MESCMDPVCRPAASTGISRLSAGNGHRSGYPSVPPMLIFIASIPQHLARSWPAVTA